MFWLDFFTNSENWRKKARTEYGLAFLKIHLLLCFMVSKLFVRILSQKPPIPGTIPGSIPIL